MTEETINITLNVATPCCNRKLRLNATKFVPREKFDRTCKCCGTDWTITRKTGAVNAQMRVDFLEWEVK